MRQQCSLGSAATVGTQESTATVGIKYSEKYGSMSGGPPFTEALVIEPEGDDSFTFGPARGLRVTKTTTGQQTSIKPVASETTQPVNRIYINPAEIRPELGADSTPNIFVSNPNLVASDEIDIQITGDSGVFSGATFAPYTVELLDGDGEVLGATEPKLHGVGYNFASPPRDGSKSMEVNSTAVAVPRDPGVQDDWYVQVEQSDEDGNYWVREIDHSPEQDYFIISLVDTPLDVDRQFRISIYENETDDFGEVIVELRYLDVADARSVTGPLGTVSRPNGVDTSRYDLNTDGEVGASDVQRVIALFNAGGHIDGQRVTATDAQIAIAAYNHT